MARSAVGCLTLLLAVALLGQSGLLTSLVSAQGAYTYYGHVPSDIWYLNGITVGQDVVGYNLGTVRTSAPLFIIGDQDGTNVRVYALPAKAPLAEFTVNRLERRVVDLPNGTFFKVVADKPATVQFLGSSSGDQDGTTFFTSVTGGYVGREFILMGVQRRVAGTESTGGLVYRIYALEDSDITITDAEGNQMPSFTLKANKARGFTFAPLTVYHIASSGYFMVQSFFFAWGFTPSGTAYYPSAKGGFVGTIFYGSAFDPMARVETWGTFQRPEFFATSLGSSKLTIVDIENDRKHEDVEIAASSNFTEQIKVGHIGVEADQPMMLMLRFIGMSYTGLAAGQNAYVYIPTDGIFTGEAYVFAYKETTVTVDDVQTKLPADGYIPLTGGYHKVSSSENVVIQVANWPRPSPVSYSRLGAVPEIMRLTDWAVCVPSAESMSMTYEDLKLKPLIAAGLPLIYIAAGAAAVVVIIVVVLVLRRGRKP